MNKTISYNQTEHMIQNYLVRFTHQINNKYSEIESAFVIKGANVTEANALKIAKILFKPPTYTNIKIVSIENDENTLTPAEYEFIRGKINDLYQESMRYKEVSIKNGTKEGPLKETEYDTYLNNLIKKMSARMRQFPVYHT